MKRHDSGWVFVCLLFLLLVAGGYFFWKTFPESTFLLANSSRLPVWIELPVGMPRYEVSLALNYRVAPRGGAAEFVLKHGGKTLQVVHGRSCALGEAGRYPAFEAITVGGRVEIIEHRAMEPIFYVSDAPGPREQFERHGCVG